MRIEFIGGVRSVTGSCFLLHHNNSKILIDCGLFQGKKELEKRNFERFTFNPGEIGHLLLSHAHLDHIGLIPRLIREGFKGTILSVEATKDLCGMMLLDSAYVQEKESAEKEAAALYTKGEVIAALGYIEGIPYEVQQELGKGAKVRFKDAGHILGSAIIELWVKDGDREVKLVFTGDLGQKGQPIVRDAEIIEEADILLIESTYGDRTHRTLKDSIEEFANIIIETFKKGGNVVIPSYALGRTQVILYILKGLTREGRLKRPKVILDSPLGIMATEAYLRHPECFDEEAYRFISEKPESEDSPQLVFSETYQESLAARETPGNAIIIAGGGMCEGGRIQHHLVKNIIRRDSSIVFVGYQTEGTLGRQIIEGIKNVEILGIRVPVRAKVYTIGGFSAHADRNGLLEWAGHVRGRPKVFVVHGEEKASQSLAFALRDRFGHEVFIPKLDETIEI